MKISRNHLTLVEIFSPRRCPRREVSSRMVWRCRADRPKAVFKLRRSKREASCLSANLSISNRPTYLAGTNLFSSEGSSVLAAASPGWMFCLGHLVPDLDLFPVEMIGCGWVCTGTSLAPPTTSYTSSALYWLLRGTVPRPEHLKEAKPRSISAAPDPCFHRPCDCRRASHYLLLLLGLWARSPLRR